MGTFKFAMQMLKKEYKKSLFYGVTMMIATAMSLVFFHIMNNEYLIPDELVRGGGSWDQMYVPISTVLSFVIIFFCAYMIFFANSFFVSKKTKEIAILTLSGSSFQKSSLYLIFQTIGIMVVATPIGIGVGMLIIPYINEYLYSILQYKESIYYIPTSAIVQTVAAIVLLVLVLCSFTGGYIYRNEITELMKEETNMVFKDTRKLQLPIHFYTFLYIFGIIMMFMNPHSPISYIAPSLVGVVGAVGMIRYVMPVWITKWKRGKLLTNRFALIYVSNLNYSLHQAIKLVGLMIASFSIMISVLASLQNNPRDAATAFIGYIVIVILLSISIVYKFCMEVGSRKTFYKNMWKIGYTRKEIISIIKKEVLYFYTTLLIFPLLYVAFVTGRFLYFNEMTISFCIINISVYVIPILISAVITYFVYIKTVITPIQGGIKNGK